MLETHSSVTLRKGLYLLGRREGLCARCWRSGLAAFVKSDFGLYGVVGAMTVIALAAYTNIMLCGGIHVGRNIWQV